MFNEDLLEPNWKNVVTLKIDLDNLILVSLMSNSCGALVL